MLYGDFLQIFYKSLSSNARDASANLKSDRLLGFSCVDLWFQTCNGFAHQLRVNQNKPFIDHSFINVSTKILLWLLMVVVISTRGVEAKSDIDITSTEASLPFNVRSVVVFTGQFDRIEHALKMLRDGRVDQIFITGVNPGAGLSAERFPSQFSQTESFEEDLTSGRIALGTLANNTLENAIETQCWLKNHPKVERVGLITSDDHMARAYLALRRAVSERIDIVPIPVVSMVKVDQPSEPVKMAELPSENTLVSNEKLKFLATWLITLLPFQWWPYQSLPVCK